MASRKDVGDLVSGGVLVAITAVGFWRLYGNQDLRGLDFGNDPGPALFPTILLSALGLCGLWLAMRAIVRGGPPADAGIPGASRRLLLPLLMAVSLVVYALLLPALGFIPVTLGFTASWVLLLLADDRGRIGAWGLVVSVVEAGVLTAAIYVVFARLVNVPLP